jgi:hypothetical protein
LRSIASTLLVLKDVEAYGPVSERQAHTYGSFCVFDALGMDVQNRADYAFEVECTIPCVAALSCRDSLPHGSVRVRLHADFPAVSVINGLVYWMKLNRRSLTQLKDLMSRSTITFLSNFPRRCTGSNARLMYPYNAWLDVETSLVLHARLRRPTDRANITSAEGPLHRPEPQLLPNLRGYIWALCVPRATALEESSRFQGPAGGRFRQVGELVLSTPYSGPDASAQTVGRIA